MTDFYSIGHNTFRKRGMPWIEEITEGLVDIDGCAICGATGGRPSGDLKVWLKPNRARFWPDLLGSGDYPCFVASQRFLDAMREDGVRVDLGGRVEMLEPVGNGLSLDDAPAYAWIDGWKHRAGRMDFEASGYVGVRFCGACGARDEDIGATSRRRGAMPPPPTVFDYDESLGLDLFTTDLSPAAFFCTDRVLRCATRNRLTNIEFCRVEEGEYAEPIKY